MKEGSATFHRCDGSQAHPAHREAHRAGFWTEGHRVIAFIEGYCVFPEGPQQHKPALVVPFWAEILVELYRLADNGLRQYRASLIGLPKKNAKSTYVAWLGLYHTLADDEPSPKNVCAGANDDQADLVFNHAKETAEHGDAARDATPDMNLKTLTERWDREILVPSKPGAVLRRVASGGGNLDGPNLYFRALDEIHEYTTPKNNDTYRVLFQGGALRRQPLFVMITTAGWDKDTLAGRQYERGKVLEDDPTIAPEFLFLWFEAPEIASGEWAGKGPFEVGKGERLDYRSEEAWRAANVGAGQIPGLTYERYLEDLRTDVEMTEAVARRYRLNQWTETEESWMPAPWQSYRAEFTIGPGTRNVCAIDASTHYDATAVTWWGIEGMGEGMVARSKSRVWERPTGPDGEPVDDWSVPFIEVKAHLYSMHHGTRHEAESWCREGVCICCGQAFEPMRFEAIGFDPARVTYMTEEWRLDGLPMVEVPQGKRMAEGFQAFFQLLVEHRFEHDGDEVVARHIRNSAVKLDAEGNRRLDRKNTSRRRANDAAITQVLCAYLLRTPPEVVKEIPLQIFI
jgi:phage terminase large subunit-like protein